MDNVTFYEVETISGTHEIALIANEDGSFTSMAKTEYDRQQVEHLTEIPTPDEA